MIAEHHAFQLLYLAVKAKLVFRTGKLGAVRAVGERDDGHWAVFPDDLETGLGTQDVGYQWLEQAGGHLVQLKSHGGRSGAGELRVIHEARGGAGAAGEKEPVLAGVPVRGPAEDCPAAEDRAEPALMLAWYMVGPREVFLFRNALRTAFTSAAVRSEIPSCSPTTWRIVSSSVVPPAASSWPTPSLLILAGAAERPAIRSTWSGSYCW